MNRFIQLDGCYDSTIGHQIFYLRCYAIYVILLRQADFILYSMQMKPASTQNIKIVCKGTISSTKESWKEDDKKNSLDRKNYEYAFENRLDYRDEMISIPFSFSVSKATYNSNPTFYEGEILEWLVNVVENIFSITFRHLLEQRLSIDQSKAFACKNILVNIKQLCEYLNTDIGVIVDQMFLNQLDNNLSEIVSVVINKYPQNNAKGASKRLLKFIKQISNRQNDQYDFLFTHKMSIKYRTNGDYISQIIDVVNKLINIPTLQVKEDQTLIQNFQKFCRQLFFQARQQNVNLNMSNTFKIIDQSIDAILNTHPYRGSVEQLDELNMQRQKADSLKDSAEFLISEKYQLNDDILAFQRKKSYLYRIGQKIPSEVRQFTERQYRQGQFKVYHAAILRVLTKWSQELYSKLERADELIRSRIHQFKTNSDYLRFCSVEEKEYLYEQALKEKLKVDQYLQTLKKQNKQLQSHFAVENVSGKFIKKFTNVDIFVGKLTEMVSNYIFRYLNRLIHSLLSLSVSAGQKLYENYKYLQNQDDIAQKYLKELSQINLVSFKVGDLLRAKYSCLEHEFITILSMLYKIEQIDPRFLRIIKIKNRMFEKDNDILINLFFKQQVICELQLSIHKEENKKQKLYGEFNHFIYQLKRSEFGIISQFSSIIAQHDPLVNYFTFFQHKPPVVLSSRPKKPLFHVHSKPKPKQYLVQQPNAYKKYKPNEKSIERPFICQRCRSLKTVLNPKFYYREQNELNCNECIEKQLYQCPQLNNTEVYKQLFKYYIVDQCIDLFLGQISLWNHTKQLKNIRDEKQLYVIFIDYGFAIQKGDKNPKVRFFKTFYNAMSNSVVLSSVVNGEIDNFLYLNCKKQKNHFLFNSTLDKYLFFGFNNTSEESIIKIKAFISEQNIEADFINTINIKEKQFLKKEYIKTIMNSFQKYHTTLYLNGYKYIMEYIYEYLNGNEQKINKRKSLFESNAQRINSILLESSQIFTIYPFITYFYNAREINLSTNHIKSINILQSFEQLQSLNISHNHINSIEALNKMPWIKTIIAKKNSISALTNINQIKCLKMLDCSENQIVKIDHLEGLAELQQLILSKNMIESMFGVSSLYNLHSLILNQNIISKIEHIEQLRRLLIIDVSSNSILQMVQFANQNYLQTVNLANNKINNIISIQTSSLKQLNLSSNIIGKIQNIINLNELQTLNLSSNKIIAIEGLDTLDKLKKLILNDNYIQVIEKVDNLRSLEYFNIQNNPIKEIKNLSTLKSLNSLVLEHLWLTQISNISTLKKLKNLTLANNKISTIFKIDELVRLQKLDLSNNIISKIQNLGTLKYLQILSLAHNQITKLQNLQQLLQLNWLVLSYNKIQRIEGIDSLVDLRVLQLQNNSIQQIQGLQALLDLEQLILSYNHIQKILNLGSLSNLKKLSLASNRISCIEGVSQLSRLQLLDLQKNSISKMQHLNGLGELKWLVLSINHIHKIEGVQKLQQLSKLILSHNQITKIQNIAQLKILAVLFIDNNKLVKIEGLEQSQNLEKLNLSHNKIRKLQGFEKLQRLNELNLQQNQIQKIQNLHPLAKLKKLTLSSNNIEVLENVENLKQLSYLQVSGNKINQIVNIHNLPYLEYINLAENPVNNVEGYGILNQHVKLCLQLIMHKFDSQNLKKSQHQVFVDNAKMAHQSKDKEVEQNIKFVRNFAKSFYHQF